ncbi:MULTISPECIES: hypothetical protein [unclassified Synechococcus]|nr:MULTISPECIES: hypothetical protein [unclassified Synechococcus]
MSGNISLGAAMTYFGIDRGLRLITAMVWTGSAWIQRPAPGS